MERHFFHADDSDRVHCSVRWSRPTGGPLQSRSTRLLFFFYSLLLLPPCTFISFLQAIAEVKSFMPTLCEPLVFFFVWFVPLNVFPFLTLFFSPVLLLPLLCAHHSRFRCCLSPHGEKINRNRQQPHAKELVPNYYDDDNNLAWIDIPHRQLLFQLYM